MRKNSRRTFLNLLSAAVVLVQAVAASAQANVFQARLFSPDTGQFPRVSAYIEVNAADGSFMTGLVSSQVSVIEDGVRIDVDQLEELNPGAQMAIAFNPGRALAIRDGMGVSRYDRLLESLTRWAGSHPGDSPDDLSLVIPGGSEVRHTAEAQDLIDALVNYPGDLRTAEPGLEALETAIQMAAETNGAAGMGRGVLFITPLPESDVAAGLQNLAAQSKLGGVRIFIWLVGSPDTFTSPVATQFKDLAEQSGGVYFPYTGEEPIPNVEGYLDRLGSVYSLSYRSQIKTSGPHQLEAEVRASDATALALPLAFEMNILPPNVAFVAAPTEINRVFQAAEGNQTAPAVEDQIFPLEQDLEILVDFPDGIVRPVLTTTLYIDGVAVETLSEAPLDHFTWNLKPYLTSATYRLQVEVFDELGLSARSEEKQVVVNVEYPAQSVLTVLSRRAPLVAGLSVVLAGAVLGLVLILSGKLTPHGLTKTDRPKRTHKKVVPFKREDPLTQPVEQAEPESTDEPHKGWLNRLHLQPHPPSPKAQAYLTRLTEDTPGGPGVSIPIASNDLTFGRDADKAAVVLNDPSIESLHARLRREGDSYRLCDEGSVAGTWVNYSPVSKEGALLEHGDLVHIGRAGFRFNLREPGRVRKPVIKPEEPAQ